MISITFTLNSALYLRFGVSVKAGGGLKSCRGYEILILEKSKDFSRILILEGGGEDGRV